MKSIEERLVLQAPINEVWNILSDISRCDWLPTVNHVELEDDCRVFEMEGMGKIKEKIIEITKQMTFLKNIELTLFIALTITVSEIQKSFIGSKYKIKNFY